MVPLAHFIHHSFKFSYCFRVVGGGKWASGIMYVFDLKLQPIDQAYKKYKLHHHANTLMINYFQKGQIMKPYEAIDQYMGMSKWQ